MRVKFIKQFFLLTAFGFLGIVISAGEILVKPIYTQQEQIYVSGKSGKAVKSQGASAAFLQYPCDGNIVYKDELSLAFWVKREIKYPSNWAGFIMMPGFKMKNMRWSGKVPYYKKKGMEVSRVSMSLKSGKSTISIPMPEMNQWTHYAFTRGKSGLAVYVNGELKGKSKKVPSGFSLKGTISFFPWGAMDETILVRREMDAAEIKKIMNGSVKPEAIPEIAAYWSFNDTVEAKYFSSSKTKGFSLFYRTGKGLNIFRDAYPTKIEFNLVNWGDKEFKTVFGFHVESLDKKVLCDVKKGVSVKAGSQKIFKEEIPKGINGMFYVNANLADLKGEDLDKQYFRVVRTIAPDVKDIPADANFCTGVVEGPLYNWPEIGMKYMVPRSTSWGRRKFHPDIPVDWSDFDSEVACADENGVELVYWTCHIPPFEATDGKGGENTVPKDWTKVREFIEKALIRYKDKIKYIEVLNEPYYHYKLDHYVKFCQVYREAIDKVAPEVKLIASCGDPTSWGINVIQKTIKIADIFQVHSYPNFNNRRDPLYGASESFLLKMRETISALGGKQEIWNTESGIIRTFGLYEDGRPWTPASVAEEKKKAHKKIYSEYTAANWVTRGYVTDAAGGVKVGAYFQYPMLTAGNRRPCLQMVAMGTFAGLLTGSDFIERMDMGSREIRCYRFEKGGDTIICLWTALGRDRKTFIDCQAPEVEFVDIWGTRTKVKTDAGVLSVTAKDSPFYIVIPNSKIKKSKPVAAIYPPEFLYQSMKNEMRVVISNPFEGELKGTVTLEMPEGLAVTPSSWDFVLEKKGDTLEKKVAIDVPFGVYYQKGTGTMKIRSSHPKLGDFGVSEVFRTKKSALCSPPRETITIDGDFSEWKDVEKMKIGNLKQLVVGSARPAGDTNEELKFDWEGPNDMSGEFSLLYDDKNLYLALKVRDDGIAYNANRSKAAYNGDCVELFLDMRAPEDQGKKVFDEEVYQIFFVPVTEDNSSISHLAFQPAGRVLSGVKGVSRKTDDGWLMEIAIPFSNFKKFKPENGALFGFNLALDDSDGPESKKHCGNRKSQLIWSGDGAAFSDPNLFGKILLKKTE